MKDIKKACEFFEGEYGEHKHYNSNIIISRYCRLKTPSYEKRLVSIAVPSQGTPTLMISSGDLMKDIFVSLER